VVTVRPALAAVTALEVALGVRVLLMPWVALSAAVVPPLGMGAGRRWTVPGVVMWLTAAALAVGWLVASVVEMDGVDATGEAGNAFSEVGWSVGAVAAATASIVLAARRRRGPPPARAQR
jgi:hypothetical protein